MSDRSPAMQWDITVKDSPQLISVKVSGRFDVEKCELIFNQIATLKGSNAFTPILIDDREADLSVLSPSDLMDLGELFMRSQAVFAYSKVALLMNPGSDFDTANKFQSITKNKFASFSVFSSEEKALKFLAG